MWGYFSTPCIFFSFAIALLSSGCTRGKTLGNTLRVALRQEYRSLDPVHSPDFESNVMVSRAYEGLLHYNYAKRPYELEPLLAAAMPAVSKDGKTYTFKIRPGVRFQDDAAFAPNGIGREIVAEDFVYSFKRLIDPKTASEGAWIFNDLVEDIKAVDAHTLEVRLKRSQPLFLHRLAMPYASVVAREAVQRYGQEFGRHPVGTGPFRLEYLSAKQLIWVRNAKYFDEKLHVVDRLVDDIIIEDSPAWLNFLQANHDYLMRIPKDTEVQSQALIDKGISLLTAPGSRFTYIVFNMEDAVVGGSRNRLLREAMSIAYDEAPAIAMFEHGLATIAQSPIPPGIAGYDANYRNPAREYNLAKARDILEKAGYPGGTGIPELVLDLPPSSSHRQAGEYFQMQMQRLGVKVRLNPMAKPELMLRQAKKQSQLALSSWTYDYPDAENGWQLLYSKNVSPGSNKANYADAEFDRLYEKLAVLTDGAERSRLQKRMREIFARDVPWILLSHPVEARLVHPWIKGFKIHLFEYNIEKYLSVDVAVRDKALREGI